MNCKPGDLAVIKDSDFVEANGHFVNVLRLDDEYEMEWICQPVSPIPGAIWRGHKHIGNAAPSLDEICIPDKDLRPIRDPGDDAKDESLDWLPPVPSTQKEFV